MNKISRSFNYINYLLAKNRFFNNIKKTLPKRHPLVKINKKTFEDFFMDVDNYQGVDSTLVCISEIWSEIILNYKVNIFEYIDEKNIDSLVTSYESYYANGISDGASSGIALDDLKVLSRKNLRNHLRAFNYYEANNTLTKKQIYYDQSLESIYENILTDINLPESILIGQPWCWSLNKSTTKIHFELIDYIYFSKICLSTIEMISAESILVLGDGSGVNCALINANSRKNINLTHVDLSQYLLMQYIVNYEWRKNSKYFFAENFPNPNINQIDLLINMDSFPEMTESEVKKYVRFVRDNKVKFLLSYNHKINDDRQTNFRKHLYDSGMKLLISYPSIVRPGWFIELFKAKE
jgi:hypothetical protein